MRSGSLGIYFLYKIMEYCKNLSLENISYINDECLESIEIWKDIPDYVGLYQVSDLGRVKSLNFANSKSPGILKQSTDSYGYLVVAIKRKGRKVHQLVGMAFQGLVPDGTTKLLMDHIEQNRKDNRSCLLRIATPRINASNKHIISSSKYIGVSFNKILNKWVSYIHIDKTTYHLGVFINEEEASKSYQVALINWDEFKILPNTNNFSSDFKGVCFSNVSKRWRATIRTKEGVRKQIGVFKTEAEAIDAILKIKNHSL